MSTNTHGRWSGNLGFILAACGSAIGLSNIWKFPYTLGESGGSAFLLCYIIATIFFAIPGLIADTFLGRRGRGTSAIQSVQNVLGESNKKPGIWIIYGIIGAAGSIILLSYYSIIGSWSLGYTIESIKGHISSIKSADDSANLFVGLITNSKYIFLLVLITLCLATLAVGLGIEKGIEKFTTVFMGFLFAFTLVLLFVAMRSSGFSKALKFMFVFDPSKLTFRTMIEATGQAFFSVSVGFCGIAAYSSMLDKKEHIVKNSIIVAFLNTLFSIIIGIAIFSLVFTENLKPDAGPSLVFQVFPLILRNLPFPNVMSALFFFMIFSAGATSIFNILETPTQAIMGLNIKRPMAALISGIITFFLSTFSILGFTTLAKFRILPFGIWKDMQVLDTVDFFISNLFFPLNAIILFVIVGWLVSKKVKQEELEAKSGSLFFSINEILMKFVAPVAVFVVMLFMLKLL